MTSPNHINITTITKLEELITLCGGVIPFESFLMSVVRPRIEKDYKVFTNFYIVKYNLNGYYTHLVEHKPPYLIVFWSGDNNPIEESIWANNIRYDLSVILTYYREYKINIVLTQPNINE